MPAPSLPPQLYERFRRGLVIPAHPLALDAQRRFDERRQNALTRYYLDAGAGGIAVGVHTTQFEIRDPQIGLFQPVLALASATIDVYASRSVMKIAGLCGRTPQAVAEAAFAREQGYHAGLLSLAAMADADCDVLIDHCRAVAEVLPVIGFYLQPAVGGRVLPYAFWRRFVEIEGVIAVKIAPFNRYQTLEVIRAVCEAGREGDIALYTGNDDHIVLDLLTPFAIPTSRGMRTVRFAGGLLGHWAVGTKTAVGLLEEIVALRQNNTPIPTEMLKRANQVTDCNAAFFDVANGFAGCIAGLHEVLRRQGLLAGVWCLNPDEQLSPGQAAEIDRVYRAYPHLHDDDFVRERLATWLDG